MKTYRVNEITALYIHIPFCIKKCAYCNFNSIKYQSNIADSYLKALEKEIDSIKGQYVFKSVYIGGGTPTVLNEKQFKYLLNIIDRCIGSGELKEYTIEANPGAINQGKIKILKDSRVNRISLGVQTFDNCLLKTLGRIHANNHTLQTFSMLRETGFNNINLDLIFGIPLQTVKRWENDLQFAISMNPEHISTYSLTYENGTKFKDLLSIGAIEKIRESDELEMYKSAINLLTNSGFEHYEISNFAKKGKKSLHNMVYWKNQGYAGIGAGAFSFINGKRKSNEANVDKYIENVNTHKENVTFSEHLTPKEHAAETVIMGLRMRSGISDSRFLRQTGFRFADLFNNQLSWLKETGFINLKDHRLTLTVKGLYVADSVMAEFL